MRTPHPVEPPGVPVDPVGPPSEAPALPSAPGDRDTAQGLFGPRCPRETIDPGLVTALEAMQAQAATLGVRLVCARGEGPGPHAHGRAVDLSFATHGGYGGRPGDCSPGRNTTVCRAEADFETWRAIFEAVRGGGAIRWLAWEYWARDTGAIPEDGSYPRGRSAAKRHRIRDEKWRHEIGHFELR